MKRKNIIWLVVLGLIIIAGIKTNLIHKEIGRNYDILSTKWDIVQQYIDVEEPNLDNKYNAISEYNEAVQAYNTSIKIIPNNLYARLTNHKEKKYFVAKSKNNPIVNFKK